MSLRLIAHHDDVVPAEFWNGYENDFDVEGFTRSVLKQIERVYQNRGMMSVCVLRNGDVVIDSSELNIFMKQDVFDFLEEINESINMASHGLYRFAR